MELPKHIFNALSNNKTSLGKHPSFPPDEEEAFLVNTALKYYSDLLKDTEVVDVNEMRNKLSKLLTECISIERKNKNLLEQLATKVVTEMFNLPEDTIEIELELTDNIDTSKQRDLPEKTEGFTFDSISDMEQLTDEIYKRRLLNALVCGAAIRYSENVDTYLSDLFNINQDLPALYSKILKYNKILLFLEKEAYITDEEQSTEAGTVDVIVGNGDNSSIKISAKGIITPILIEEVIKGIFEVAILHGLPKDRKKAEYIVKKSDFKLAEVWDSRLGLMLWNIIEGCLKTEVEPNFLLMSLSELPVDEFNDTMKEVFACTAKGIEKLNEIAKDINHSKEQDKFNSYIKTKNDEVPLEDGYFESQELIVDDLSVI